MRKLWLIQQNRHQFDARFFDLLIKFKFLLFFQKIVKAADSIDSFLEVVPTNAKNFWLKFRRKLETIDANQK